MDAWTIQHTDGRVELAGELRISDAARIWRTLLATTAVPEPVVDIDLERAAIVDGAVMALLVELRTSLATRGVRSEIVGAPSHLRPLLQLYQGDQPPKPPVAERREGWITRFGTVVERMLLRTRRLVIQSGQVVMSIRGLRRLLVTANWRALAPLITRAGTDGIPIVLLLNFLVGFVMGFQSMPTLRIYGATIYVADIVGISVTRELAPLMTAIIMSGRSGAAFAAELGTMRVSEEIDALRTMGMPPIPYLVVPRVLALAIVAPALTLLGDVVGVLGGLVVAATLDITPRAFIAELQTIIIPSDVWTGLIKSVAFGIAIAAIGCRQGLRARGSASAVGRATTATVVACLFTIVLLDTLFTVFFLRIGL